MVIVFVAWVAFLTIPVATGIVSGIKWPWLKAMVIVLSVSVILHELAVVSLNLWVASCRSCQSSGGPLRHELGRREDQFAIQMYALTLAAIYCALASIVSAAAGRLVARRRSSRGG
jgi:hypothetical protein